MHSKMWQFAVMPVIFAGRFFCDSGASTFLDVPWSVRKTVEMYLTRASATVRPLASEAERIRACLLAAAPVIRPPSPFLAALDRRTEVFVEGLFRVRSILF